MKKPVKLKLQSDDFSDELLAIGQRTTLPTSEPEVEERPDDPAPLCAKGSRRAALAARGTAEQRGRRSKERRCDLRIGGEQRKGSAHHGYGDFSPGRPPSGEVAQLSSISRSQIPRASMGHTATSVSPRTQWIRS